MTGVDAELLSGRPQRAVFLPTAAAEEGPERVKYWIDLGIAHYRAMGVEPVPLEVLDREDADRRDLAARIEGAGLVYLSGGNPGYLAHTLAGTSVWQAILDAWQEGTALAGCSAGACALSRVAEDLAQPGRFGGGGLAVVPQMAVLPHFDRIEHWVPGLVDRMLARTPQDAVLVGIDERTALVGHGLVAESGAGSGGGSGGSGRGGSGGRFTVRGEKSVWRIDRDGSRSPFSAGEHFEITAGEPREAEL